MARGKRKMVTDEASNDEVTSRPKPRPRKKQGVTKTFKASVKALIRKNASTSPLLLLPPEVRENILLHLLGDNLIHVKYLDVSDLWLANKAMNGHLGRSAAEPNQSEQSPTQVGIFPFGNDDDDDDDEMIVPPRANPSGLPMQDQIYRSTFRHAICVAHYSEQHAYDEAMSGDVLVPEGESPEHYVPSFKERHAACKMCGTGPMYLLEKERRGLRVDLTVLGVCRQLYEEANHLLWATNTFSFDDPKTLGMFFSSLNPAQKRNLTSIHISADVGGLSSRYYTSAYQRARWDSNYWGKGIKIPTLNTLRGVQTLHLCINQSFDCFSRQSAHDSAAEELEAAQEADMESILRLRTLSVKHVTVLVSDDIAKLQMCGREELRWTARKKNEYGESIRLQLVDPSGAELVKTEAEAASLTRKREIRDSAAARVKNYKLILEDKRADTLRAANWASCEEARAVSAEQKANRVFNKSSKKAKKLQDTAQRHQSRARHMRDAADATAEREKYWQEQLANAQEKLKRAMVKLGVTPEDLDDEEENERLIEISSGSEMDVAEDDTVQARSRSEDEWSVAAQQMHEASDEIDDSFFSED